MSKYTLPRLLFWVKFGGEIVWVTLGFVTLLWISFHFFGGIVEALYTH